MLKKSKALLFACIMALILPFSISVNASSHFYSVQNLRVAAKTSLSKQSYMQYAARRSYRSNRSYRPTAPRSNYRSPGATTGRNFLGYAGAFGIGSLFGSMLNPFGGYYGGQHYGFSFFGLLLDILLIVAIIWFVKKIFRRSNRNHY